MRVLAVGADTEKYGHDADTVHEQIDHFFCRQTLDAAPPGALGCTAWRGTDAALPPKEISPGPN
ncbi:hypothetical protein GCM10018963_47030 [Saccharothrix longispora]